MRLFHYDRYLYLVCIIVGLPLMLVGVLTGCAQNDDIDTRLNKTGSVSSYDVQTASTLPLYNQKGWTRLAINESLDGSGAGGASVMTSSTGLAHTADIRIQKLAPMTADSSPQPTSSVASTSTSPSTVPNSSNASPVSTSLVRAQVNTNAVTAPQNPAPEEITATKMVSFEWKEVGQVVTYTVDLGTNPVKPLRIVSGEAVVTIFFMPKSQTELIVAFRTMPLFQSTKVNSRSHVVDTIAVAEFNDDSFVLKRWVFGLTSLVREAKTITQEKNITPYLQNKMNEVGNIP